MVPAEFVESQRFTRLFAPASAASPGIINLAAAYPDQRPRRWQAQCRRDEKVHLLGNRLTEDGHRRHRGGIAECIEAVIAAEPRTERAMAAIVSLTIPAVLPCSTWARKIIAASANSAKISAPAGNTIRKQAGKGDCSTALYDCLCTGAGNQITIC